MGLKEKSERIKEELDILKSNYDCTVTIPSSIDEYTQEWQYLFTFNMCSNSRQTIKVNVHEEYIDVFTTLPPRDLMILMKSIK